MPILPDVVVPDYSDSKEPLLWTQMEQLRGRGFFASDLIALNLTRGEAMQLLTALTFRDYRKPVKCHCCGKYLAPGRCRGSDGWFICYHCVVVRLKPLWKRINTDEKGVPA